MKLSFELKQARSEAIRTFKDIVQRLAKVVEDQESAGCPVSRPFVARSCIFVRLIRNIHFVHAEGAEKLLGGSR